MEIGELNNRLRKEAIELGACDRVMNLWTGTKSKDELIDLWIKQYGFAYTHDWPSLSTMQECFDKDTLHNHNVYLNDMIEIRNADGTIIINGDSSGTITARGYSVVTIYLRHNSNADIIAEGLAKVFVHCFENTKANIIQTDASSVFIYKHGDTPSITTKGNVHVRQSQL